MEFRWIAIITLWTLLAGPMFDSSVNASRSQQTRSNQTAKTSPRQ